MNEIYIIILFIIVFLVIKYNKKENFANKLQNNGVYYDETSSNYVFLIHDAWCVLENPALDYLYDTTNIPTIKLLPYIFPKTFNYAKFIKATSQTNNLPALLLQWYTNETAINSIYPLTQNGFNRLNFKSSFKYNNLPTDGFIFTQNPSNTYTATLPQI